MTSSQHRLTTQQSDSMLAPH